MNKLKQKLLFALLSISGLAFAASSFTTHYDLEKPAAGDVGWADALNSNADEIDSQMYINQESIQTHIADPTDAHAATAILTTEGSLVCLSSVTVQDYLDCLDSNLGSLTTGAVVTLNTDQTIVGQKTFTAELIAQGGLNATGTLTFGDLSTGLLHSSVTGELSSSLLVDADVDAAAAIAYSKLDLADSIVDADINSSAAIDYSKLALTGDIVDADINASAAIAVSKLAPLTASRALVSDGSGFVSAATTTATEIGYVNGVTSAIQTQLDAKQATGNYITSLTTDVVASGAGAAVATIQSNVVTNAKLAQMPTLTIKGNNTGGTANAADLTVAHVNTMLGSLSNPMTTQGDVIYGGASGTATRLAVGAASKVLRSDGTNPVYDFPEPTIATKTGAYTLVANDNLVTGDSSGGIFTLTLPAAAAGNSGKRYSIRKTDTSFNAITVTDGTLTTTLNTQNEAIEVYSTGSAWLVKDRYIPSVWTTFTPTGAFTTTTTYTGRWKRVGDSIVITYNLAFAGAPNSVSFTLNMVSGLTIDSADYPSTVNKRMGTGFYYKFGTELYPINLVYSSTSVIGVNAEGSAATYVTGGTPATQAIPATLANQDTINITTDPIPVSGWNG